jgi:hypothetical protein
MPPPGKPKLLDQARDVIRRKHYSIRTDQAYIDWIKRFIIYHGKRQRVRWIKFRGCNGTSLVANTCRTACIIEGADG